jgi:hypothetical protein
MNRSFHSRLSIAALKPHRWLCLLVAFFLLYNPFLSVPRAGQVLEVCHPVRHRATVGASELQHFSPASGWDALQTADLAQVEVSEFVPDLSAMAVLETVPLVVPSQRFFGHGLWFRPPPAL